MMVDKTNSGFPLTVGDGRIGLVSGDDALRGKIVQVLFTAPGERVHQPEFGCGLFNLVFEPNDSVLAAAMEFTIGQALGRWLANELAVEAVAVEPRGEEAVVAIVYTRKRDLARQALRIRFR